VIDPPEGDLAAYLRSLERLRDLQASVIHPGHGEDVADPPAVLREYLAHRAMRERQVLDGLRRGPATATGLVPGIYEGVVPPEVFGVAARQVLAHLLKLEAEGRVRRQGEGDGSPFELA
jgi:glyoxylase-like metal-dependent hydrolase (beta-lactamase superfamily II)